MRLYLPQVPPEYLQPQQETSALANEFNLRYRTLEIRFLIDKERFGKLKQLVLKCSAKIENFPLLTRDRTISLLIGLADGAANQKLINNWRNSGKFFFTFLTEISSRYLDIGSKFPNSMVSIF